MPNDGPFSFAKVLKAELEEIIESRGKRSVLSEEEKRNKAAAAAKKQSSGEQSGASESAEQVDYRKIYEGAHKQALIGLAFSGGGIRSATFNLGILQGLASHGLLKWFDYISTVSGGRYIGSWLAAWIKRESLGQVEAGLAAPAPPTPRDGQEREEGSSQASASQPYVEPGPINFLRAYSNYLTPRKGIFGADTWAAIAIYLRNALLNLIIFVALLGTLVLAPRILLLLSVRSRSFFAACVPLSVALVFILFIFLLGFAIRAIVQNMSFYSRGPWPPTEFPAFAYQLAILWRIVAPMFAAAWLLSCLLWIHPNRLG
jgi:hypothetical protein